MGSATWRDLVCVFFPVWPAFFCVQVYRNWFCSFGHLVWTVPWLALVFFPSSIAQACCPCSEIPKATIFYNDDTRRWFFCLLHANPQHCPTFVEYRRTGQMIGSPECRAVSGHALSRNVGREGCTTFTTPGEIDVNYDWLLVCLLDCLLGWLVAWRLKSR